MIHVLGSVLACYTINGMFQTEVCPSLSTDFYLVRIYFEYYFLFVLHTNHSSLSHHINRNAYSYANFPLEILRNMEAHINRISKLLDGRGDT